MDAAGSLSATQAQPRSGPLPSHQTTGSGWSKS